MHTHSRRTFLYGGASLFAWNFLPKTALAAGKDPRLLVVVLRGGLDGLSTVAPIGDPDYVGLREKIALTRDGEKPAFMLDNFFGLHPALTNFHDLYKAKEALLVHSVHSPYRERSHFDGQDVLESGYERVGFHGSGWLNRAFNALERAEKVKAPLGVGPQVPLIVRGLAPITAWQPQVMPPASENLRFRLQSLYDESDPQLAKALSQSQKDDPLAKGLSRQNYVYESLTGAAKHLSEKNGPRLGALSIDGFDTHASEGAATGQLANRLALIDNAIPKVKELMGEAWRETVILFITEFGRTAKVNGTEGTDHGMATVAFMMGGAVKGGRVVADWAGLKQKDLYEGRDLKPTTDLRSVIKGILAEHVGVDMQKHGETIFPASLAIKPMNGLVM